MPTCNILSFGIIQDTYEAQGWDKCSWKDPDITYEAFVTGLTETYNNNTPLKDRIFSDYLTRLYNECFSANTDTFVSGGTLNAATGVVTFTNSTGGTLDVSGFNGFTSYWSANTDGSISNSGTTSDVKFYGDVYTDQIKRYTNNSTSTKINLSSSNVIKLFAGDSTNEVFKIESGSVTTKGNLTVTGTTSYTGAISGTGSVTAIGGFVGNLTGTADVASVATTVTLTDESSDITCFPVFSQTATGDRALETGSNLTFNSSTGLLTSTQLSSGIITIDDKLTIDNSVIKTLGPLTIQSDLNVEYGASLIQINSPINVGIDGTGLDINIFGDTSHRQLTWDQSEDKLMVLAHLDQKFGDISFNPVNYATTATTTLTIDNSNTSNGIKIGTNYSAVPISIGHTTSEVTVNDNLNVTGNADIDGTTNLDAVDIDGAVQVDNTITVGVDDTGYDVKFFGATTGRFLLWDEANDRLKYRDNVKAVFGTNNDLEIYHDDTDNHIEVTNTLNIATANSGIAVNIGHTTSETTINDNLIVTGDETIPTRKYELPSSITGSTSGGDVYYYGNGSTVKGSIYYIDGANWSLADADTVAASTTLLAVALGTDPDVDGMLLRGFVTLLTEVEGTEAIGSVLYLSATDTGIATITAPTGSGDIVRVIGYSLHATDNQVYLNPDGTWVQLT